MTPSERLLALENFGIKLGLENITRLCEALGHPERSFASLHVAGTNGKGSVTSMVHAALQAAGIHAARYTSPHLSSLTERFVIGDAPVAPDMLDAVTTTVLDCADRLQAEGVLTVPPTFFEATTAIGFELFRQAGVAAAVIEVGLGGRFDATNVITPVAGAITTIGLDHQQHLGETRSDIAFEKAGIIKPGMPVVAGDLPADALEVVRRVAAERGATLIEAAADARLSSALVDGRASITVETPEATYGPVLLALRGEHQVGNALVAIRLLEAAGQGGRPGGLRVPRAAVEHGLATADWPARLELLPLAGGKKVLLDAAHNADGAQALADYLGRWYPSRPPLVIGVMRDKDVDAILGLLLPRVSAVIATMAPTWRALPADDLAARVRRMGTTQVEIEPDPERAIARALELDDTICVAGSIFLAGAVRDGLEAARHAAVTLPKQARRYMRRALFPLLTAAVLGVTPAHAQAPPAPAPPPSVTPGPRLRFGIDAIGDLLQTIGDNQLHIEGNATLPIDSTSKMFADRIDLFIDTQRIVAEGNVTLQSAEGLITASRVELNASDGTGTFYDATGVMSLGDIADPTQFGTQDPDVYFRGERIDKLGARRYRITRGGFTTCVQPEPRWQMVSRSVEINLDDYAIARNMVFKVKGVPLLYLPIVYYPIQDEDRATGFLLPTYGMSDLRGQAISNAFFWAIGRSQDATFVHDWFTKAGQGVGAEYRYVSGAQSFGTARARQFFQEEATYTNDEETATVNAGTSYELLGSFVQALTPTLRARGRIDYASNILTQQLYQQSVARSSNPVRTIEGGLSGAWGALSASGSYQHTEAFADETRSTVYGSTPRFNGALAPQQLFGLPIYGAVSSEYAYLPYRDIREGVVVVDKTLARTDISPSLRVPLSGLTYLTVNSNAAFRHTYYTRSQDEDGNMLEQPLSRSYLSLRSDIVGPVVNKIWDTPTSLTSERRKHVIEPAFAVELQVSPIENYTSVPVLSDQSDVIVGATTRLTYGLTNRLFTRARSLTGGRGGTREVLTVGVQQTYYSNPESGRYDPTYQSAFGYARPVDLSPVSVNLRFAPLTILNTNGRVEYDVTGNGLQLVSAGGGAQGALGSVTMNYSWRHVDKTRNADNYVSTSSSVRLRDGSVTATYGLSWDIGRGYIVSQTVLGSYMAQCCGLQVEYQQFNYPDGVGIPLPSDRRINFGFVLAGLGTFSNFFGAFGGTQ